MQKIVTPVIKHHVKVCGNSHTFCAHPLYGEMLSFGNGEITFMHQHLDDFEYTKDANVRHGQLGVHAKAKIMLTRSYDGGYTWPESERVVVLDQGKSLEEKRAMFNWSKKSKWALTLDDMPPVTDDTVFHFGQVFCGEDIGGGKRSLSTYMARSSDKGKTWDNRIVEPENPGFTYIQAWPTIVAREGKILKPFVVSMDENLDDNSPYAVYRCVVFSSEDGGITWQYVSEAARDPYHEICYSYPALIDFGGDNLAMTSGAWKTPFCISDAATRGWANTRWASICFSDDLGLNWTKPRIIQTHGVSPYPLLLRDGRLLIVYARRLPVSLTGMYGIVSGDGGKTWSDEFILRHGDAGGPDIGYPEAVQLENGDIFMGYYYSDKDGLPLGGARYIAGTIFTI